MPGVKAVKRTFLVTLVVALLGCATQPKPFEYHPDNELKQGPGLFSGEDGVFTIYEKPMNSDVENSSECQGSNQ